MLWSDNRTIHQGHKQVPMDNLNKNIMIKEGQYCLELE